MYRPIQADLTGRVALVTGANSGMGKETARELARMGAEVVLGCRNAERGNGASTELTADTGNPRISPMSLDLSSTASVRDFADTFARRYRKLDLLVNNAATSLRARDVTEEGFERTWATNVLGPYLLTSLLTPALAESRHGRIVNVSTVAAGGLDLSDAQYERRRYSGIGAYRASKQAVSMLTWALADRLLDDRVTANALNPGYVMTDLTKNTGGLLKVLITLTSFRAETPLDGADTAIWLAASPDVEGVTGRFWNKRREVPCKFRHPAAIGRLVAVVDAPLAS